MQDDAFAEQAEAGAAVHLAFEHLDLVDGALDFAGAPVQGQAVGDGLLVVADAGGEGAQVGLAVVGFYGGSQDSRSWLPVRPVIISANPLTCPARAWMCGQRSLIWPSAA